MESHYVTNTCWLSILCLNASFFPHFLLVDKKSLVLLMYNGTMHQSRNSQLFCHIFPHPRRVRKIARLAIHTLISRRHKRFDFSTL